MSCTKWQTSRRRRIFLSYLKDWLLVFIMILLFFSLDKIHPFHREFSVKDTRLMFTSKPETVPVWLLIVVAILAPMVFIALVSLAIKRSGNDFHNGFLGLCLSLSMTIMVTEVIKITVGRPRPDFFARCHLPPDAVDPPFGLSNYTICLEPADTPDMIDGFKSFPSGHASFSFAGLGFLAFYLAGKMHLFDELGHTYKGFIFAFPWLGALLVAISRTRDYKHHWTDVFVGGILGGALSYFAYRQYFPSLTHPCCDKPYGARIRSNEFRNAFPEADEACRPIDFDSDPDTVSRYASTTRRPDRPRPLSSPVPPPAIFPASNPHTYRLSGSNSTSITYAPKANSMI
ncbi:phosphatidic acid phosphatase type 2/haloperoxidase [Phycomyces nitens]|nr:phosphatidic acid phosphatase type 2/haloperoxidase [Phycomyces nitens]